MQKYIRFVRKYPLSLICLALVWYLSFFSPPKTGAEEIPFIDKWTHLVMYGGTCSMIWIEYLRSHVVPNGKRLFLLAWLAPIVMSGCIELLQEYCTDGRRSGEWLDLAANASGVTLAIAVGLLARRWL